MNCEPKAAALKHSTIQATSATMDFPVGCPLGIGKHLGVTGKMISRLQTFGKS